MQDEVVVFWFRRDLRLHDNHGFHRALESGKKVLPIFVFDVEILEKLEDKDDARVTLIYGALAEMDGKLKKHKSSIKVFHSRPLEAFSQVLSEFEVSAVYANEDYEPYARERDGEVEGMLLQKGIKFLRFKDQAMFAKDEVLKADGKPYTVYTPYMKRVKEMLKSNVLQSHPSETLLDNCISVNSSFPSIGSLGFERNNLELPVKNMDRDKIREYDKTRDFPALDATTRLGPHLRFGTVSIRELATLALELNDTFLNELIWRDFFQMILWHFPHSAVGSFRKDYDNIQWRNNEEEFNAWCEGRTGYPWVDAGMRQLNTEGFMHNRVRMAAASFLCKHLLIDWRWGEAYFAKKLLDYDMSANVGNWQWAAGSGCDAAPYFRIFNPQLQAERFDPQNRYIQKWVPEYGSEKYVKPIVDHKTARERALKVYAEAVKK
jgi:deoxyribodipyrimidine photo-lyase